MSRVKKTKNKFKFTPQFGILMMFLLGLLVASIWILTPTRAQRLNEAFGNTLPDDHRVVELRDAAALETRIASGELTFLFFGIPSEQTSRTAISTFYNFILTNELARNFREEGIDIGTIHFLNASFVDELDEDDEDDYEKIQAYNDRLLFDVTNTPDFVLFYDGEVAFGTERFRDEDGRLEIESWGMLAFMILHAISDIISPE